MRACRRPRPSRSCSARTGCAPLCEASWRRRCGGRSTSAVSWRRRRGGRWRCRVSSSRRARTCRGLLESALGNSRCAPSAPLGSSQVLRALVRDLEGLADEETPLIDVPLANHPAGQLCQGDSSSVLPLGAARHPARLLARRGLAAHPVGAGKGAAAGWLVHGRPGPARRLAKVHPRGGGLPPPGARADSMARPSRVPTCPQVDCRLGEAPCDAPPEECFVESLPRPPGALEWVCEQAQ